MTPKCILSLLSTFYFLIFVPGSGAVALAHLDGSGTDEAVCTMVQRVQELALGYPEGRIELQLIGGFSDARHYSEELFYNVMSESEINSRDYLRLSPGSRPWIYAFRSR
jgi:hypothetical protein